ncbi:MAG: hypothetical protein H5T76_18625, partial [Streptomyces sp.]|nr:hypothetical protein [Streptomyces sp.]
FSATPTTVRGGPALPGADTATVARDWDVPRLTDPRPRTDPPRNPQRKASS